MTTNGFPNQGTRWSTEDMRDLKTIVSCLNMGLGAMAIRFGRSPYAIECKVGDLAGRGVEHSLRIPIAEYVAWLDKWKIIPVGGHVGRAVENFRKLHDEAARKSMQYARMYGSTMIQSNMVGMDLEQVERRVAASGYYVAQEPLSQTQIDEVVKEYIEGDINMTNQVNTEANITPAVKIKHITTVNGHDITKLSDQDLINQVVKCEEQISTLTELNTKLKISQIADTIVDLDQTKTLLTVELAERSELAKSSD